jgi:hypothetical protein
MPNGITECCDYTMPTTMPTIGCPKQFGQIIRLGFQIKQNAASFPTVADLIDNNDWTVLLAAAILPLNNQILVTPVSPDGKTGLFGSKITGGAVITQGGGDDTTLGGIPANVSREWSKFEAMLYSIDDTLTLLLMDLLDCGKSLTVYFINSYGQIIAKKKTATSYEGFDIRAGFLSDRTVEGEFVRDVNSLTFMIEKGFSRAFYVSEPTTFATTMVNP